MSDYSALFVWLESTVLARAVGESLQVTAWLSAMHLIGFTLIMGGGVLTSLRLLGTLFSQRTVVEILRPAGRVIGLGLAISLATGVPLFSPRAASVIASGAFQLKMLLLVLAVLFHFALLERLVRQSQVSVRTLRATGTISLSLWVGLAVTACVFILFE